MCVWAEKSSLLQNCILNIGLQYNCPKKVAQLKWNYWNEFIMQTTAWLSQWNIIRFVAKWLDHTVIAIVIANSSLNVMDRLCEISTDWNVP